MKPFRNRLRDALAPLIPVVQVALITAAAIGNVLIAASIFLNAKKLGALFLPALALYFVLLTVLLAAILRRRELDRLHALSATSSSMNGIPGSAAGTSAAAPR